MTANGNGREDNAWKLLTETLTEEILKKIGNPNIISEYSKNMTEDRIILDDPFLEETKNWNNKQWQDYLFQNGVMDIEAFRQKCDDIVDEMIERKYGKSEQS